MKKFGTFMMMVGIVVALAGVVGFVCAAQSGYESEFLDFAFDFGSAIGANSYMSAGEKLMVFIVRNRITMMITGAISFLAGCFLRK